MGRLDDKVVIVTGASRGIGKDIAVLFAAEGGKVICAARTVEEGTHPLEGSLNTTIQKIRDAGEARRLRRRRIYRCLRTARRWCRRRTTPTGRLMCS